jgi:hypothetical protein
MKVRFEVHGLSAFLPEPFDDHPRTLRVLIPDVREPVSREDGDVTFEVCAHTPKLVFPEADEEWPLHGEHIILTGGAGKIELHEDFKTKVQDMDKIAPGAGTLDRFYLADPPTAPGPDRVNMVAALQIDHGLVTIGDETPKVTLRSASSELTPIENANLAAYVQMEIEVPGNQLTITTKKFGTREITRQKVLKGSGDETLEVILSNGCDREEGLARPDEDFIIYYDFCRDYHGPKYIPYPAQLPGVPGVNASATTIGSCIAGLFNKSA